MPSEPRWITSEEIVWINEREVAKTGEPHQVSDLALLESAVARPRHKWWYDGEEDVVCLAAALIHGIAKNHPFVQGNKRAGTVGALMFLSINGYEWALADHGELAEWVLAIVNEELSELELAELMRPHLR